MSTRKTQVYIEGIPTMVNDDKLTDGVKYYKADGTPDVQAMALNQVDVHVAEAKANIAMTDVAMTVDMFQKMTKQEQEAMTAYREKNLAIVQGGQVTPNSRMVNSHLQSAFGKFKIGGVS